MSSRVVDGLAPRSQLLASTYPCLCLCFWFVQITRTTPRRRTTLHLSHIRFTDALTFMMPSNLPHYPSACQVAR